MFSAARTQLAAEGQLAQSETPTATVPAAVHKALESGREIKRQTPAVPPAKYLDNVRCPGNSLDCLWALSCRAALKAPSISAQGNTLGKPAPYYTLAP